MALSKDAQQAPGALSLSLLEQDIEHRFSGLRRLLEATDRINPGVLLDEAFHQLAELYRSTIPGERFEIVLLDDREQKLARRWLSWSVEQDSKVTDDTGCEEALQGSLLADILALGEPRLITALAGTLASPVSSAFLRSAMVQGMRSALIAPLISSGKPVGLALFASSNDQAFSQSHLDILRNMAESLSSLIAKGKLYEMVIQAQMDSERLLRNVLPDPIVKRLKAGEQVIADGIPEATVVFVDIVNFVHLSASMSPSAVIIVLNRIFSAFDALCEQYGVEKIKTIGDAYMLATGVPKPFPEHVVVAARIALDMQELGKRLGMREERSLRFRIGIHTGPVVAGVIGTQKFSYDLWGDTVNIASRMEAHGMPGRIHVSREVYQRLKEDFDFEPRGIIDVKGMGGMETYFLNGPKAGNAYRSAVWSMLNPGRDFEPENRRSEDD